MIDRLRGGPRDPTIELGGRSLPVVLRRHPTARRMVLRLAPDGSEVRITLPRWGRSGEALQFASSRTDWLTRQLAAIPENAGPRPGGLLAYRGKELRVNWRPDAPRKPAIEGEAIVLGGPEHRLAARLQRWLETEALLLMGEDLSHYAALAEVGLPVLRLSRARRRWGSCSSSRTLRINWRLVQAPDFVRRSVVAHEVAHLMHFDHSPRFHALLARIYESDLRAADRWLKDRGRTLYAMFG